MIYFVFLVVVIDGLVFNVSQHCLMFSRQFMKNSGFMFSRQFMKAHSGCWRNQFYFFQKCPCRPG